MSQRRKPEVITIRRFYDGDISVQDAFQPVLETSIRDAAKERLEQEKKSEQAIQNE